MIPTKVHGILDYLVGILLLIAPYLFGFADGQAAQWIPMVLGAFAILYSLITDYEWSLAKILPMRIHLILDGLSGAVLLASPWLFGFSHRVFLPHVIFGAIEITAALMTEREWTFGGGRIRINAAPAVNLSSTFWLPPRVSHGSLGAWNRRSSRCTPSSTTCARPRGCSGTASPRCWF